MKKIVAAFFAVAALGLGLSSCGSKGLTQEEIEAKANEQFNAQKESLIAEAEEACNQQFDGLVTAARDSVLQAAAAQTETETK